jgi:hypothetical protein
MNVAGLGSGGRPACPDRAGYPGLGLDRPQVQEQRDALPVPGIRDAGYDLTRWVHFAYRLDQQACGHQGVNTCL